MSGNKSSFKQSIDPPTTGAQDDDCLTWLQYPTDDSFERNYCSNLFQGEWPLAIATEGRMAAQSDPDMFSHEHEGSVSNSIDASLCQTGSQSGPLVGWRGPGTKTPLNSRLSAAGKVDAEEALAQGAARAAGHSWPLGQQSLTKVRTLMQPTDIHPPPSTSAHSFSTGNKQFTDHSIKLNLPVSSLPASVPNPVRNAESMRVNRSDSYPTNKINYVTSEHTSVSSKRSRTEFESRSHLHQPESRITEAGTPTRGKEAVVADHQKWTRTSTSYSGASQTSMSLSGRGTTYRERSNQEDSEFLLDDFTEDDSMDAKRRSKLSSRRNRVPEVHNLSERIRRSKINEKLKALQDLVPNSSKIDKASVLDEAIEYMKALQTQLQMVSMRSSLNVSTMMMPMSLPQTHLPVAQPQSIGIGVPVGHPGMGMGLGAVAETGLPIAATLFQCPTAMMSQMHSIPLHGQNMAAFAHLGFPQNAQMLPVISNIQERPISMHQRQNFSQGWSAVGQPSNFENETASVEQDDFSD